MGTLVAEGHFFRICDGPARLLLKVSGPSVPELGDVQAAVEYGR